MVRASPQKTPYLPLTKVGYLLTLSPIAGVNYLNKNMNKHLEEPLDAMFDNDDASALGHVFQAFAQQGTSTWHRRTTEWFLVRMTSA